MLDALGWHGLTSLRWAKTEIVRYRARKQKRTLCDQSELSAEFPWLDIAIVDVLDIHRSRGGLVETIQQTQQRSLARTARPGDGKHFSFSQFEGCVLHQDLIFDGSTQMFRA